MIQPAKLFENVFEDREIIDSRLANFMNDHISRLTARNGGGAFTALIALLTPPYQALAAETGDVGTALTKQVGATITVDNLIKDFRKVIKAKQGVIADVLGGTDTPAYIEFYPHGLVEYTAATKEKLPLLLSRLSKAAETHKTELGTTLTATLKSFDTNWTAARKMQSEQKGDVSGNRAERSDARQQAELALVKSVHTIGLLYPGDVAECTSLYSFNMLFAKAGKKDKETVTGTINPQATAIAFNVSFTTGTQLSIKNTAGNASLFAWIAATATAQPSGKGIEIKAGDSRNATLADLGDEGDTFLLIKNLSEVNGAGYVVEMKG